MSLRISAGAFKGRKIKSPYEKDARPLSGIIKEALFSILSDRIRESFFLDMFAGTGSAGLEALSRGAGKVVFVEKSPGQVKLIKENISSLGVETKSEVVLSDVFSYSSPEKADIIFAGPPYRDNLSENIIRHCLEHNILCKGNILIIQHHRKEKIGKIENVEMKDSRKYGISSLDFFSLKS